MLRIAIDQDELEIVSRQIAGAASAVQEIASRARRAIEGVKMPLHTSNNVRQAVGAASAAISTVADVLVAESNGLGHKASCCEGPKGGLATLAVDNWAMSTPASTAADTALGLGPSSIEAALTAAIIDLQASGDLGLAPPDNGFTVIDGSGPFDAFKQLGVGPQPSDMQTIGGLGNFGDLATVLQPSNIPMSADSDIFVRQLAGATSYAGLLDLFMHVPQGTRRSPTSAGSNFQVPYDWKSDSFMQTAFPGGKGELFNLTPLTSVTSLWTSP